MCGQSTSRFPAPSVEAHGRDEGTAPQAAGKLSAESKEDVVKDGDIMHFSINAQNPVLERSHAR